MILEGKMAALSKKNWDEIHRVIDGRIEGVDIQYLSREVKELRNNLRFLEGSIKLLLSYWTLTIAEYETDVPLPRGGYRIDRKIVPKKVFEEEK